MADNRKRMLSSDEHLELTGEQRLLRAVIVDSLLVCWEYQFNGEIRNVSPRKVRAEYEASLRFLRRVDKNVLISLRFRFHDLIVDLIKRVIAGDGRRQSQ